MFDAGPAGPTRPRYARARLDDVPTAPLDTGRAQQIAAEAIRREKQRRAERRIGRAFWVGGFLLSAWLFMIGVGVARAQWLPGLPTIDYGTTLLLQALFSAAIGLWALRAEATRLLMAHH